MNPSPADDGVKPRRRRSLGDDRGMTAIEFVFLTPVVFMIMMATVQFSMYLFAKQAAQSAARAGDHMARAEASDLGCMAANAPWQTHAQTVVAKRAHDIGGSLLTFSTSDITATATPDYSIAAKCQATVTVDFQAEVPRILPWAPKTVHVTASGPVEQFVSHP